METSTVTLPLGSPESMIPLTFLRTGQSALVGDVVGSGGVVHRLREMGLRAGAKVQMLRAGSPCILRLDGQKLCVRSDEMSSVLVKV